MHDSRRLFPTKFQVHKREPPLASDPAPEPAPIFPPNLAQEVRRRVLGQEDAVDGIVPYIETFRAGLAPSGRPAGVFLLLGPTGTGKTRTVEALAEAIHGDPTCLVRINCGEFQLDHEVAKLIGAPPGYLGHRETQPLLTQSRLIAATSARLGLTLVLFDEIEKAAPSLMRLLLGVLDRATLRLGDGTTVNFERTLIFFTSNLGAQSMEQQLRPRFGFARPAFASAAPNRKLEGIATNAARKFFSPEFVNRIDALFTYKPLSRQTLEGILDHLIEEIQDHLDRRLGSRNLRLEVLPSARRVLLDAGCSPQYGARELRRTVQRMLAHPLAELLVRGCIPYGATLRVDASRRGGSLRFRPALAHRPAQVA